MTEVEETFGRYPGVAGPRVLLVCACGHRVTASKRLFEHTWKEHGRMPTKAERTPQ